MSVASAAPAVPSGFSTAEVLEEFAAFELKKDALYYYQDRRKCLPIGPPSVETGERQTRLYTAEQLEALSTLLRACRAGFTLDQVAAQLARPPDEWSLVPSEKLKALVDARRTFIPAVLVENARTTRDRIERAGRDLLECESFRVELVGLWAQQMELTRAADNPFAPVALPDAPADRPLRLQVEALARAVHVDEPTASRRSLLQVPLLGRKSTLGYLQAWNRQRPGDARGRAVLFDRIDEAVAVQFARDVVDAIEALRLVDATHRLAQDVILQPTLVQYLRGLLAHARDLTGADRGDIFWLDDASRQLIMAAQDPPDGSRIPNGSPVPDNSIVMWVFRHRETRIVEDVSDETLAPDYFPGAEGIHSEMATPLLRHSQAAPIAVLNLESRMPRHFDAEDRKVIERLAANADLAAEFKETHRPVLTSKTAAAALSDILKNPKRVGFNEGVIYIADYRAGQLRLSASHPRRPDLELDFKLDFESKESFAVKVLHDRAPRHSADPWNDEPSPTLELKTFDIDPPMLGVPLLFGSVAVGVLVVWRRKGHDEPSSVHDENAAVPSAPSLRLDATDLQRYAGLVVTTHASTQAEAQRQECFRSIRGILSRMQERSVTRDEILRATLKGLTQSVFERARVFEYVARKPEHFVCRGSFGVNLPDEFKGESIYVGDQPSVPDGRIDVPGSRWARQTRDDMLHNRLRPQIRTPLAGDDDYYGRRLKRPQGLDWAVAPLNVRGTPIGYLAADNAATAREITESSLEYLALFGDLAALAIADETLKSPR